MTTGPGIEVRGGVGGTAVGFDELVVAAGQLVDGAAVLGEVVIGLAAATAQTSVSAPLSPVTALRAESELALAAQVVATEAAALAGVAGSVRAAAWAYREVEDEVVRTAALTQDVVMAVAGHAAPTLVVGVVVLDALGVDVGTLVDRAVWEVPELADLGGGAGGLVLGLRTNPVTAPFVSPPFVAAQNQVDSGASSRPGEVRVPPDPDQAAIRVLADSAAAGGLLRDTGSVQVAEVTEVTEVTEVAEVAQVGESAEVAQGGVPSAEDGTGAAKGPLPSADDGTGAPGAGLRAPAGLADLARDQATLPDDARVRVVEVRADHGSAWVVEISGTQVWDPRAGSNPFDLTTDVRSMAGESTLLAAGVQQALSAAQARAAATSPPGRDVRSEPVLLSGHSLGGIVAAGLASSAEFRSAHRVTHVVALGSPIGKVPVPDNVQVLAVEHRQDPVPRLEGRPNPDRAGWVTVTRDLDGATDRATDGATHTVDRARAAHRSDLYVETAAAVDASDDPSVAAWRAGSRAFFAGPGEASNVVVRDYRIARVVAEP
ncbi:hypothetical protein ABEG17_11265 [Pedococcus sp. KACC 23699]|uniref:GPI inositol-deacylase PGAP1-like alpha/beta domain-containing protein n=1 Tax=Pedococcus sp. KACC 23699 TaxID=3149228 RepID=A0AAU7JPY6_9MICO